MIIEQTVQRFATLVIIEERIHFINNNVRTRIQTLEAGLVGHASERRRVAHDHVRRFGPGPGPLPFQGRPV